MTTNLVVADDSRTEKTICLAVSPSLKSYGISGRARLFEVVQKVTEINTRRQWLAPGRKLCGASSDDRQLKANPSLALEYIVAPPRMAHYLEYSTRIYQVYLKYVAPEDIHIYSIDEVFIDVTHYMGLYGLTPRQLAQKILKDVLEPLELPPPPVSVPTCIWPKSPWISWPSGCLPTGTVSALRSWTNSATAGRCGRTGL